VLGDIRSSLILSKREDPFRPIQELLVFKFALTLCSLTGFITFRVAKQALKQDKL